MRLALRDSFRDVHALPSRVVMWNDHI
jgi:hypothetical protein